MKHISQILDAILLQTEDLKDQQFKIRVSMVEDYMKCKRLLAGWGLIEHQRVLENPSAEFDYAYDLDLEELDKAIEALNAEAGRYVKELHFPNGRWTKTEPPQPEF